MSFRTVLSIITIVFLGLIVYFSRHEIYKAWLLLEQVNVWILLLLIPGQLLVYYAGGEMAFAYLRSKGSIGNITGIQLARMSLEMNFVNHVLPSAGVSGLSYMTWRFGHFGISPGRATMSQVVRFAMAFVSFVTLLLISLFIITLDGHINRWILLFSALLVVGIIVALLLGIFLLSSQSRINRFSASVTKKVNRIVAAMSFQKVTMLLHPKKVDDFFDDLHKDYLALSRDKRILTKPYLWGLVYAIGDVLLFMITFWALGAYVNPAILLIAYGLGGLATFFVITPGGAGAYEAIMVAFLVTAGVTSDTAIAGTLLTRVILLLGTIGLGYFFYQHAILRYGRKDPPPTAI